jgi:hypothetical protein
MSASLMTDEDSTTTPRQIRFVEEGPMLVPPSPILPAYKNQELRSNLMRHLADRDPLDVRICCHGSHVELSELVLCALSALQLARCSHLLRIKYQIIVL